MMNIELHVVKQRTCIHKINDSGSILLILLKLQKSTASCRVGSPKCLVLRRTRDFSSKTIEPCGVIKYLPAELQLCALNIVKLRWDDI
jgi:hypothetical protein